MRTRPGGWTGYGRSTKDRRVRRPTPMRAASNMEKGRKPEAPVEGGWRGVAVDESTGSDGDALGSGTPVGSRAGRRDDIPSRLMVGTKQGDLFSEEPPTSFSSVLTEILAVVTYPVVAPRGVWRSEANAVCRTRGMFSLNLNIADTGRTPSKFTWTPYLCASKKPGLSSSHLKHGPVRDDRTS